MGSLVNLIWNNDWWTCSCWGLFVCCVLPILRTLVVNAAAKQMMVMQRGPTKESWDVWLKIRDIKQRIENPSSSSEEEEWGLHAHA